MKKPEISFRPIGESGPLALYWHTGPYGDAVECKEGSGVVWVSSAGELLGVEFDDVNKESDHQVLITAQGHKVEVWLKQGKVRALFTESATA